VLTVTRQLGPSTRVVETGLYSIKIITKDSSMSALPHCQVHTWWLYSYMYLRNVARLVETRCTK